MYHIILRLDKIGAGTVKTGGYRNYFTGMERSMGTTPARVTLPFVLVIVFK